jgi:hypothetical protein
MWLNHFRARVCQLRSWLVNPCSLAAKIVLAWIAGLLCMTVMLKLSSIGDWLTAITCIAEIAVCACIVYSRNNFSFTVTVLLFVCFFVYSTIRFFEGSTDCRCFGENPSNPIWAMLIDLNALALLVVSNSRTYSPRLWFRNTCIVCSCLLVLSTVIVAVGGSAKSRLQVVRLATERETCVDSTVLVVDPWCKDCQAVLREVLATPIIEQTITVVSSDKTFPVEFQRIPSQYHVENVESDNIGATPRLIVCRSGRRMAYFGSDSIVRVLQKR